MNFYYILKFSSNFQHIDFGSQESPLTDCELATISLLLVRNILKAPEQPGSETQYTIIWNLFSQGIDRVIINLLSLLQKVNL